MNVIFSAIVGLLTFAAVLVMERDGLLPPETAAGARLFALTAAVAWYRIISPKPWT